MIRKTLTAWFSETCRALRAAPAEPRMQSRRVLCTISIMVLTPLPGSPMSCPQAPRYSTSLEALALSPSLSLRRITWKPVLRSPLGFQRGTRKHEGATLGSAAVAAEEDALGEIFARVRKPSHIGAEVNHFICS